MLLASLEKIRSVEIKIDLYETPMQKDLKSFIFRCGQEQIPCSGHAGY